MSQSSYQLPGITIIILSMHYNTVRQLYRCNAIQKCSCSHTAILFS